jgi:hypothetical protein
MLSSPFFLPGSIPLLPEGPFYGADTSNYPYTRDVAQALVESCMDDYDPQCGGWQSVGGRYSLGVFLWGTLSVMDRMVGRSVNGHFGGGGFGLEVGNGTLFGVNGTWSGVDVA